MAYLLGVFVLFSLLSCRGWPVSTFCHFLFSLAAFVAVMNMLTANIFLHQLVHPKIVWCWKGLALVMFVRVLVLTTDHSM